MTRKDAFRPPSRPELTRGYVRDGQTLRQMGEHYGVAPNTVRRWLRLRRIETRPTSTVPLAENVRARAAREAAERRKARNYATAGAARRGPKPERRIGVPDDLERSAETMGLHRLARHYGRNPATVRRWLADGGIVPLDERCRARPSDRELRSARAGGETFATIGAKYGVSRQRAHQWWQDTESALDGSDTAE